MKHRRNARRFWLVTAVLVLAGPTRSVPSATPADASGDAIRVVKVGNVTFELARIPAGRFSMGSATGDPDEKPIHKVRIDHDFYMGRTEVTVRQFRAFTEATGYKTDAEQVGWANTCPQPGLHPNERGLDWRRPGFELGDDQPVVVVSWNDAMAFCRWLGAQTGRNVRLPTEAEWEYAARAGGREDSPSRLDDAAWYEENASDRAHPVGTKRPNPWGLYDLQGNAWEWCLDVWRPDYREAAPDGRAEMHDPVVPQVVWRHVLRGGSWFTPIRQLSLSYRARYLNHFSRPDTGFRIVLVAAAAGDATATAPVHGDTGGHGSCAYDSQKRRTILEAHGIRFEFARVPAGEFLMGGTDRIEKPVHKVRIGYDFEMGTTEVTIGQFRAFIQATGYPTDGEKVGVSWSRGPDTDWQSEEAVDWCRATRDQSDDHPAIFISWYDAMAFCHWLSGETGQEIRLPSEAEWEYACRAGTTGLYAGDLDAMGWYRYNACERTHPVAQKQPNAWGLYDMHGNVWEWCLDFFRPDYKDVPTDGRPRWEVEPATDVVSRGGSFRNPPGWLASGCRMGTFPDASHGNNGFRLVRVPKDTSHDNRAARIMPVNVDLSKPLCILGGDRVSIRDVPHLDANDQSVSLRLPPEATNVALGKPVTANAEPTIIGELPMITDGRKDADARSYVELPPGLRAVTIDLEASYEILAVRVWHCLFFSRVYFDVIVQVSDDPEFIAGVHTIFNNDIDNSAGLGTGTDWHYIETPRGKLIDAKGVYGRYVRLYSNGNNRDDLNHYVEVEVYAKPRQDPDKLAPLGVQLPRPAFVSVPSNCFRTPNLEKPLGKPRPPFLVPAGTTNVALGKPVTSSWCEPVMGALSMITDGKKEADDDSVVELGSSVQHVTVDLRKSHTIYAIVVWHWHRQPRVYFGVVVRVADDPAFGADAVTLFNNDLDNSLGLGAGKDLHYIETCEGKLIDAKGVPGRYVRLYSNGNTSNDLNHYLEVEVYGKPVAP